MHLDKDPTNHAEGVAIRRAAKFLDSRHLENCILYVTHETCSMCASAAIWAKLKGIVFGARLEDMKEYAKKHENSDWSWRTIGISASEILKKRRSEIVSC